MKISLTVVLLKGEICVKGREIKSSGKLKIHLKSEYGDYVFYIINVFSCISVYETLLKKKI